MLHKIDFKLFSYITAYLFGQVDWLGSVDSLQEAEFSIWFIWLLLSLCLLAYLLYRSFSLLHNII